MVASFVHGPGTLTLGGGATHFEQQLSAFEVEPTENVTAGEVLDFLDGGQLNTGDTANVSWKVNGTSMQDLGSTGLVAYSWDHSGEEIPFVWVPNSVAERQVSGTVVMVPIKLGGAVKKRNTSDFSWRLTEAPVLDDTP